MIMRIKWVLLLNKISELLGNIDEQDYRAREDLVTRKINIKVVLEENYYDNNDFHDRLSRLIDSNEIYSFNSQQDELFESTTGLAIAICLGENIEKIKVFLDCCSDVNNVQHFVCGYRQKYSYVHLVTDPVSHISSLDFCGKVDVIIENRSKLLELLAIKEANFNWRGNGHYANPPITFDRASGNYTNSITTKERGLIKEELSKKLILLGSNPAVMGSSFCLSSNEMVNLIKFAARNLMQKKSTNSNDFFRYYPDVLAACLDINQDHLKKVKYLLMGYQRINNADLPGDLVTEIHSDLLDLDDRKAREGAVQCCLGAQYTEGHLRRIKLSLGLRSNI